MNGREEEGSGGRREGGNLGDTVLVTTNTTTYLVEPHLHTFHHLTLDLTCSVAHTSKMYVSILRLLQREGLGRGEG